MLETSRTTDIARTLLAGLALALLPAWSSAHAAGGTGDADPAWSGLDSEIEALRSSLAPPGTILGATLRAQYQTSNIDSSPGMGNDSGVLLGNADVWVAGRVGQLDYHLRANLASGDAELEDAWAATPFQDWAMLRLGRFKPPVLRSSTIDPDGLMMVDRSVLGRVFDTWDEGVMLSGDYEGAAWSIAMQNGASGTADDQLLSARVEWSVNDGVGDLSSAFGHRGTAKGSDYAGTLGISAFDEQSATDGSAVAYDMAAIQGNWFYHAELMKLDAPPGLVAVGPGLPPFPLEPYTSPWSAAAAFVLPGTSFELTARWQDLDDSFGTEVRTAGFNWYGAGKNARWQLNVTDVEGNLVNATFVQLGLTVGIGPDTPRTFGFP